jgi:hypothetical protein
VIVIGVRTYLCHCAQLIPQDPFCGDRGWKMMNRSLYEKKDYAKNRGLGDSGEAYSQGFGDSDESVLERVLSCGAVV